MDSISDQDSSEQRASKERIFELFQQWLGISSETTEIPEVTEETGSSVVTETTAD